MQNKIAIKVGVNLSPGAIEPSRSNEGDLIDVYSLEDAEINSVLPTKVRTGVSFNVPVGFQLRLYDRSSNSTNKLIYLSNSVGVIDTRYKNEICGLFMSFPKEDEDGYLLNNKIFLPKGSKIMQFSLVTLHEVKLVIEDIDFTNDRGGGFGSTGN